LYVLVVQFETFVEHEPEVSLSEVPVCWLY